MFYSLPPVGQKIIDRPSVVAGQIALSAYFESNPTYFFASGAQSLAAAITAVIDVASIDKPEVLLSAYACPEVVSAVLFAGAKPILIDMVADRPWMDLSEVANKISDNTVAIIAINLFGIPERISLLYAAIGARNIRIIEDSAQAFPLSSNHNDYQGDLIIHSFGRGKPVSVLGGGVVVCRQPALEKALKNALAKLYDSLGEPPSGSVTAKIKINLYNLLIHPRCYWLPASLPFLKLGLTVFTEMVSIEKMAAYRLSLLPRNIEHYQKSVQRVQADIHSMLQPLKNNAGIIDLAQQCCSDKMPRLLRYPLLFASKDLRDRVFVALNNNGLGASKLYPSSLPKISGLEVVFAAQGDFVEAESFAQRLLTLPTHAGVMSEDIRKMRAIIEREIASSL